MAIEHRYCVYWYWQTIAIPRGKFSVKGFENFLPVSACSGLADEYYMGRHFNSDHPNYPFLEVPVRTVDSQEKTGKEFGNMRPTISDIAQRAGVSKTTVSRVLNNRPDVDDETRETILKIIEELNYTPSLMAKSLSTGRKNLLGLLVPSISKSFSLEIIRGVASGIEDTQFELVLFTTGLSGRNQELYSRAVKSQLVDGLLIVLPRNDNLEYLNKPPYVPCVIVDYTGGEVNFPRVTATNKSGAYDMTRYLIELGHKRIGFITGLMDLGCSRERLEGYMNAMNDVGLAVDESLIGYGDFTRVSGSLIAMNMLQRKQRPTAIFASNDEMAFGVMGTAQKLGISIPEQLSLAGFDDSLEARFTQPTLTTVRQPLMQMGREAVKGLINLIEGQQFLSMELKTELIIRESCQSPLQY